MLESQSFLDSLKSDTVDDVGLWTIRIPGTEKMVSTRLGKVFCITVLCIFLCYTAMNSFPQGIEVNFKMLKNQQSHSQEY